MSRDELSEMEQLDDLAQELAEAGRIARAAGADGERPQAAFTMRLRAELVPELACPGSVLEAAPAEGGATGLPLPPTRPLDAPERFVERRRENRPFAVERRGWAGSPELASLAPDTRASRDHLDTTRAGKRWATPADEPAVRALPSAEEAEEAGRVTALHPSMRWHIPTRVMPSRWIAAGLAASVAIAALFYGTGILWPVRASATADEAVAATLVRDGTASTLIAGTELREGDQIRVASGGRATLMIGASIVRLDSGADLRLDSLDPNHETVNQLAGRVYHRVSVPAGGDYRVVTATVTWEAHGTAFDLDRHSTAAGGEEVRGLALQHGVGLDGPGVQANLQEGTGATVQLVRDGAPGAAPVIEAISSQTLAERWLVENAGLDARLGLPLGLLASISTPTPTVTPVPPTERPALPNEEPSANPPPTAPPTATPTAPPTATPTRPPTPQPTPTGPLNLGQLTITDKGGGTYKFQWPKYTGSGFQYYKLVYGPWGTQPSRPASPYWTCNTTAGATSWSGAIPAGDYAVRVQVIDEPSGKTIIRAQSNLVRLTVAALPPTVDLGALGVIDNGDGTFTFNWTAYTGGPFSYYKLVYEPTSSGKDPSYPGGSSYWAVPGPGDTSAGPIAIPPGDYKVRIQAIDYPGGHAYAYAQTAVLHLVVTPSPTPTPTPTPTP